MKESQATLVLIGLFALRCIAPLLFTLGIGYLMNTSFRTFQYQEAAAIVLVLISLVMLVDYLSSRLRKLVV